MMNYGPKFWFVLLAFEVVFGFAVFAITRAYYLNDADDITPHASTMLQTAPVWPNNITTTQIERLTAPSSGEAGVQDPADVSRQADEYFGNGQYDRAAELYERLVALRPDDADAYNNLGLTLHYVGRSDEALRWLNEGISVNPQYQRIWLTLGYVNSQLGNVEEAREALTTAMQAGTDESIRQSAQQMLEALP